MKHEVIIKKEWQKLSRKSDFAFIRPLLALHPEAEVFIVGGAVRDILLEKLNGTDFDFVVRNVPKTTLSRFLKNYGKVNFVGKKFGVFKLSPLRQALPHEIDIALPRTEIPIKRSGAYKDFKIESDPKLSIEADLSRRDFTINAIAWNIITGQLIDPFDGLTDLKKKKIDTVGIPLRRLSEDYSRLLRAIRLSCQLGFDINPRTWKQIKKLAPQIQKSLKKEWVVPREVVAKEILKAFTYEPSFALNLFYRSGLLKQLMPELLTMRGCPQPKNFHTEGDVWKHTELALKRLSSSQYKKFFPSNTPSTLVVIATLLHDVGKPATLQTPKKHKVDRIRFNGHDAKGAAISKSIATRLKFSSVKDFGVDADELAWLIKKHLLLVHGPVSQLKNSTLEKYFFNKDVPGNELLQLFFTDGSATIPKGGKVNLNHLKKLFKRLEKLAVIINKRPRSSLLTGRDIIKEFKLKEGPIIGELLTSLREAELSGKVSNKKQAFAHIKKVIKHAKN
jgi:tRNA nucleotidyltransferase/poly(A) polymerase